MGQYWPQDLGNWPHRGQGDFLSWGRRPKPAPCSPRSLSFFTSENGYYVCFSWSLGPKWESGRAERADGPAPIWKAPRVVETLSGWEDRGLIFWISLPLCRWPQARHGSGLPGGKPETGL